MNAEAREKLYVDLPHHWATGVEFYKLAVWEQPGILGYGTCESRIPGGIDLDSPEG